MDTTTTHACNKSDRWKIVIDIPIKTPSKKNQMAPGRPGSPIRLKREYIDYMESALGYVQEVHYAAKASGVPMPYPGPVWVKTFYCPAVGELPQHVPDRDGLETTVNDLLQHERGAIIFNDYQVSCVDGSKRFAPGKGPIPVGVRIEISPYTPGQDEFDGTYRPPKRGNLPCGGARRRGSR